MDWRIRLYNIQLLIKQRLIEWKRKMMSPFKNSFEKIIKIVNRFNVINQINQHY